MVALATSLGLQAQKRDQAMEQQVFYRAVKVGGLSIFYRETGPKDAPTLVLLHGLPSSSRMFQPLLARLADKYHDYRTNVDAYPSWQAWMQKTQPALLVLWGKHDLSFDLGEPERYRKDVPNAEVHVLDAGHFALDTKADDMAELVRSFMKTQK
jgi:pimeloyl-ACP methyl ester carboxylesterase